MVALGALQVSMALFQVPAPPVLPGDGDAAGPGSRTEPRRLAARQDPRGPGPGERWPARDGRGDSQRQLLLRVELPVRGTSGAGCPTRMTRAWSDALSASTASSLQEPRTRGRPMRRPGPARLTRAFAGGDPYWISGVSRDRRVSPARTAARPPPAPGACRRLAGYAGRAWPHACRAIPSASCREPARGFEPAPRPRLCGDRTSCAAG